ncbi:hypothetical protein AB0H87_41650, partial [Asanoa sp. NPDC050611]
MSDRPDVIAVTPLRAPLDATVRPPGSKSITNRALLCASFAPDTSTLTGALFADDTRAMLGAIAALGATVDADPATATVRVTGVDPRAGTSDAWVDARQSGTTSRFILPAAALRPGRTVVDGSTQLRARPFGPVFDALRDLGAVVSEEGRLPATIQGPMRGGPVRISGHLSSQFLSGLLMAGPLMPAGLAVELTSPLVSVPYVEMTRAVMRVLDVAVFGTLDDLRPVAGEPPHEAQADLLE